MERIYFDNAASTPLHPVALAAMEPYWHAVGNPSSVHKEGRFLRVGLEEARRQLAHCLGTSAAELFFTSSGTEANNWAFACAHAWGVQHVFSNALEHTSVQEPIKEALNQKHFTHQPIAHTASGHIEIEALAEQLLSFRKKYPQDTALLTLMHANNEIGTLHDIATIGELCHTHHIHMHTDMVQTIGHLPIVLDELPIDMASISAHKCHGPKGIGLLYVHSQCPKIPWLFGGGQERGLRAGTENVAYAVGMATALTHLNKHLKEHMAHGQALKTTLITQLQQLFANVHFNGTVEPSNSLWSILNFALPLPTKADELMMNLDMQGIALSIGSACASGAIAPSHVLSELHIPPHLPNPDTANWPSIRCSFSHLNTQQEIHTLIEALNNLPASLNLPKK